MTRRSEPLVHPYARPFVYIMTPVMVLFACVMIFSACSSDAQTTHSAPFDTGPTTSTIPSQQGVTGSGHLYTTVCDHGNRLYFLDNTQQVIPNSQLSRDDPCLIGE